MNFAAGDYEQITSEAVAAIAKAELRDEKLKKLVAKKKAQLQWPWYKKLFPYRIKITITDLRRES